MADSNTAACMSRDVGDGLERSATARVLPVLPRDASFQRLAFDHVIYVASVGCGYRIAVYASLC